MGICRQAVNGKEQVKEEASESLPETARVELEEESLGIPLAPSGKHSHLIMPLITLSTEVTAC